MQTNSYWVYIMTNRALGVLYTGVTNDLSARAEQHRIGGGRSFTERYHLKRLVWYEQHADIEEAIAREKRIKRWRRSWKIKIIEEMNPDWRDLRVDFNE